MTAEIAKVFLQYGLLGAITILAIGYGWKKDREMKAAQEAHQAEMTKFADRYIAKSDTMTEKFFELARDLKALVDAIRTRSN